MTTLSVIGAIIGFYVLIYLIGLLVSLIKSVITHYRCNILIKKISPDIEGLPLEKIKNSLDLNLSQYNAVLQNMSKFNLAFEEGFNIDLYCKYMSNNKEFPTGRSKLNRARRLYNRQLKRGKNV